MKKVNEFAELKSIPVQHFEDEAPYNWDCWVSMVDGSFICPQSNDDQLKMLVKKGIVSDIQNTKNNSNATSNIGFNPVEQKWYGWSHRAVYGFGVGSTCKKGDCHYVPSNKKEDIQNILDFWNDDEGHKCDLSFVEEVYKGEEGIRMTWKYTDKVPNEKLRGTIGGMFVVFMGGYGNGEWIAETLDDAKRMAIDFAESVG